MPDLPQGCASPTKSDTTTVIDRRSSSMFRSTLLPAGKMLSLALAAVTMASASAQSATATGASAVPRWPAPDAWGLTLPAWIPTATLTVTEGYDSNLYGVANSPKGHESIADISSTFTEVNATVTANFLAPFRPEELGFLKTLTLSYSADYFAYASRSKEDNLRNTATLDITGKSGAWSFSLDNPFLYVDGSREDEFFNYYNNLGYAVVRERRNQIQERNQSFLRYDFPSFFIRAVDSVTYFNLLVDRHNPVGAYKGYTNWVNRDDENVGLEFGYDLTKDFALVAAWRLGDQTQGNTPWSLNDSDSTYNRALFGFEGSPLKWLNASLLTGPDFRRYSNASHLGITGKDHTWFFLKAALTAKFSASDTFTAAFRVWHFVSSSGVSSIQETSENFSYAHQFSTQLSASVGYKILGHRYDAPTVRNDWTQSVPVDVTYAFTRGFAVSADYSATTGKSHYPVAVSPGQNFEDNLISLSLKASF